MLLVGLTGNIGMGKTTAGRMFKALGAFVIDTDEVVSELLEDDSIKTLITNLLGAGVRTADGRLDRRLIAAKVFADESKRRALEDILHPRTFERVSDTAKGRAGVVIVEAPVLFERGYESRFDKTITVFTDEETAISRSGFGPEEARRRLKSQMPIEEKKKMSDFTIDNTGAPEDTEKQAVKIYAELKKA